MHKDSEKVGKPLKAVVSGMHGKEMQQLRTISL
jgi:hypothetical protein